MALNLLSDIITYVRRIIKSPSNAVITDNLIIDYINRFWIMDVDARIQLFDLKTKYQFQTQAGVDQYNMPVYNTQVEGGQTTSFFPVYQGFLAPAFVNGIQVPFYTVRNSFYNVWPNYVSNVPAAATGNGTAGPYTLQIPFTPNVAVSVNQQASGILRGHVDMAGIIAAGVAPNDPIIASTLNLNVPVTSVYSMVYITSTDATGANVVVADSGQFLSGSVNQGLLMEPGSAPFGNKALPGGYDTSFAITGATNASSCVLTCTSTFIVNQKVLIQNVGGMTQLNGNTYTITNVTPTTITINVDSTGFGAYTTGGTASSASNTINYNTGEINVTFPVAIPSGQNINIQCYFYQPGLPRAILFYNNCLTIRNPPDMQYLVELDAYLTPAAFLTTGDALPYGYMAEYIARGAARKILADTGDVEQFAFYEPLFKEQELLVWKRSQRQWTANRSETIYSNVGFGNAFASNGLYGSGAT